MKAGVGLWNGLERVATEVVFILGFNTEKDSEFVVMHGNFYLSEPVVDGGKGGGHKEEEELLVCAGCNAGRSFITVYSSLHVCRRLHMAQVKYIDLGLETI